MKRICFFTAVILFLCSLCVFCTACEKKGSDGLIFRLNEDNESYSYVGVGTCRDENIVIPKTYNNKPVTRIAKDVDGCGHLWIKSIDIPDSVTEIGEGAFALCENLERINIPASVKKIGQLAFMMTGLKEVRYGGDLRSWLDLISASSLASNPLHRGADLYLQNKKLIDLNADNSLTIGDQAFRNCTSLISVTISQDVLGIEAFKGCENLKSATLDVFDIRERAFENCKNLENVDLKSGVTIGEGAFRCCNKLQSIEIPDGITRIEKEAFKDCDDLINVKLGKDLQMISEGMFENCDKLEHIELPDNITIIEKRAFAINLSLKSIVIPDSVTGLGAETFYSCKKLETVKIGDGVQSLGDNMFKNCIELRNITIGDGVKTLQRDMFFWCGKLRNVVIGSGITKMEPGAFGGYNYNIYYHGTAKQWESVEKDKNGLSRSVIYYYSDIDPVLNEDYDPTYNYWHYNDNGEIEVWNKN